MSNRQFSGVCFGIIALAGLCFAGEIVEPAKMGFEEFPASQLQAEGMQVLEADFSQRSTVMHLGVPYANKTGVELHLNIIEPRKLRGEESVDFPLVIYIQGSAWFKQNIDAELGQLSRFAQRGFVIASVEYRSSPVAAFPAQVKDVKTAIRFMQEHAAEYHANADQLVVWGDSSGGHTAAMVGVSLADASLDEVSPVENPLKVKAVVDYYGPTEISKMNEEPSIMDHRGPGSPEGMLIGGNPVLEHPDLVQATVPMNYIDPGVEIPPFLILHGDKDRLVPFGQSVMLYEVLKSAGKTVEFYKIKGADHGGSPFWSDEVLDLVEEFVRK